MWKSWEDRIMIGLLLLIFPPCFAVTAILAWQLLFCLLLGCDVSDGAGAFTIRIVE